MRPTARAVRTSLFRLALLTLIAASIAQHGAAQGPPAAGNSNTEVLSLGPAPQTGGFASIRMTRDFRGIAIAGNSGSRMAAFLNGIAGRTYDQVQTIPPVLSADGKRIAYAARKSGDWFMVVDGTEYGPYLPLPPYEAFPFGGGQPVPWQDTPQRPIVFSPDSKHFAFIARKKQSNDPNPLWVVVEDGKEMPQPGQMDLVSALQFSKHGDHLLWVVHGINNMSAVMLDGFQGPTFSGVYHPQFSEDGHHLAYTAQRVVQQTSSSQYVEILDGKEGPPLALVGSNAEGNGVLLSADGAHLAYPAKGRVGPTNRSPIVTHVVIDGKDIPYANRLWMSPDGKTIAYESLPPGGGSVARAVLVINGKPGLEYAAIQDVRFAPDGHVVYSVRAANSKFFVVDGEKEYGPYASVDLSSLTYSADAKHWAFSASADGHAFAVFDGRKLKDAVRGVQNESWAGLPYGSGAAEAHAQMFKFTADGHLLYHVGTSIGSALMKDDESLGSDGLMSPDGRRIAVVKATNPGASDATAQLTLDGQAGPVFREITRMTFSPDSKHFAYVGASTVPLKGGAKEGGYILMEDGVQKGAYAEVSDLQFSPDSKHLFCFTTSHTGGGAGRAYVDQENFFTFYWLPGYFAHWLDDGHTMQILGGKFDEATHAAADENMYRVRYYLAGANRKQETPSIAGPAAVDLTEAKNMLGGGVAVTSAATAAATAPAAVAAGGSANAGAPATGAITVPPGTSLTVRMLDMVDSHQDSTARTYGAVVTQAVNAGAMTIPQNTPARVTIVRNGNVWVAHLASLTMADNSVNVNSSTATINSTPSQAQAAAKAVGRVLSGIGRQRAGAAAAAIAAVASGERVYLPPGTVLTFVVGG